MLIDAIARYKKEHRLFLLYQHLPRHKDKAKSLSEIMIIYSDDPNKYNSHRKTLQNDLLTMQSIFNGMSEDKALIRIPDWQEPIKGKTPKYYLNANFSLDVYDDQTLFLWQMLINFTTNYLPVSVLRTLQDKLNYLKIAQKNKFQQSTLGQWHNHLITLPSVTQAPQFNNQVLSQIHEAILSKRQITLVYYTKWATEPKVYLVYPVGLVFSDNMVYLTGFKATDDSLDDNKLLSKHRNFAITRIEGATIKDDLIPDWVERDSFGLKNLARLGKLEFTEHPLIIQLRLRIHRKACQHLSERPLSDDQNITNLNETYSEVTATVRHTSQLQDWLVGMSQLAVVIEPLALRHIVHARLTKAIKLYDATP